MRHFYLYNSDYGQKMDRKSSYYIKNREEILMHHHQKNVMAKRKNDILKGFPPNELLRFIGYLDDNYNVNKEYIIDK